MTTYNEVFDEKQYRSVNKKAAKMYVDQAVSSVLPLITTEIWDAYEHLHPTFAEPTGAQAGVDYIDSGKKMNVRHEHEVIELFVHQGLIQIRNQDIAKYGVDLIADKHEAEIEYLVNEIDSAAFHGPKNEMGIQIAEGILGQLTCLVNQTSAAGFSVATKGEIWVVLKKAIEDIPFAMRQSGPDMILFINEALYGAASAPDRIYQDKVEWSFIYDQFIGPEAVHGRKIGQVIITNKINAEASDDTNGNNADTVDTLGTHGRFLLVVPDKRWCGRIVSAGFHLVGEKREMLSVDQLYGWHGRVYALDGDAFNYTEGLTFT